MLLEYDISVVGVHNVERAFQSIERRAAQHNVRMQQMFGGGRRASSPRQAGNEIDREQKRRLAEQVKAEKYVQNLRLKQLRDEDRQRKRIDADRERAQARMFSLRMRQLAQEDRQQRQDEAARERQRVRTEQRVARERAAADRRVLSERRRFNERLVGTAGGSAGRTARVIGGTAIGVAGAFGVFAGGDAVRQQLSLGRQYRELALNSRDAGGAFVRSPAQIQAAVEAEALRTGANRQEVLGGLEAYVTKTGDIGGAIANLKNFSDFAMAFKSNVGDIATAAATLQQQFGLSSSEDVASALASLGGQGRKGAFELVDMATQMPEIGSAAKRFGMQGLEGARIAGGLAQLAIKETGSAPEAATAVQQMFNQLMAKSGQIQSGKAFGGRAKVNVFEGGDTTGAARDIRDVLTDVIDATGGRADELLKIFDIRGAKAVSGLASAYKEAGGGSAGRDAIQAMLKDAIEAPGDVGAVRKDVASMLADDSVKVAQAFEKLTQTLGTELTPVAVQLAQELSDAAPTIGSFAKLLAEAVSLLVEHPFEGIGAIMAAAVVKDVAAAAIGSKVSAALVAAIMGNGGGAGGGAGGGRGKKGGRMRRAGRGVGLGIGAATSVASLLYMADDALNHVPTSPEEGGTAAGLASAQSVLSGDLTPEQAAAELAKSKQRDAFLQNEMQNAIDQKENPFVGGLNEAMFRNLWDPEYRRARERAGEGIGSDGTEAMKQLEAQIEKSAQITERLTQRISELGGSLEGLAMNRTNSPTVPR